MTLICYDARYHFALADEPDFPDEEVAALEASQEPAQPLQEWRTYYFKWFGDEPDFVRHLPKPPHAGRQGWSGNIREINFANHVGLTRLGTVNLIVENRKIGDDRFHAMLDNVADHYSELIFGFSGDPVGHSFQRSGPPGRNAAYVEYLFLRKHLHREDIEGIVAAILKNSQVRLLRDQERVSLALVRDVDQKALIDAVGLPGVLTVLGSDHPLGATSLARAIERCTGRPMLPSGVHQERRHHTHDSHENRFAKHVLKDVQRRLGDVADAVGEHGGGLVNPQIEAHLGTLQRKVAGTLDDPLWREVGPMRYVPHSSTVLHRREGYRQLFRLYALLQLVTRYAFELFDFENLLETKDTATLYEYWCFFQVKDILDAYFAIEEAWPLVGADGGAQKMVGGARIVYGGGLSLHFNWSATGTRGLEAVGLVPDGYERGNSYSKAWRPDIVINHREARLIFDAKNKGHSGNDGFYAIQEDGTILTVRQEDIAKMHAYRDAINGVVGAFALFPGEIDQIFPAHGSARSWDGVGALALRPDLGGRPDRAQIEDLRALILGFVERVADVPMSGHMVGESRGANPGS